MLNSIFYSCHSHMAARGIQTVGYIYLKGHYIYFFVLSYLISLFMISSLYVLVGRPLWRRNVPGVISTETDKRTSRQNWYWAVRTLDLITATFALCGLLAQCYHLIFAFRPDIPYAGPPHGMFLFWSGHTYSVVNPSCCYSGTNWYLNRRLFSQPTWSN